MQAYDFSGYLKLELDTNHRGYQRYFANEYARISRTEPPKDGHVTLRVRIVDRIPTPGAGDIVRDTRYKRLFTFRYLVRGIDTSEVTVYFARHWVDRVYMNAIGVFLQAQVVEPVMYQKLLEQGVLLMHAGGVTDGETGILLPAYGGTGKTTLSMALLNSGYRLLGDDLLLVDVARGVVHPYPRPLHIFTYNVRSLRGARIPVKYRIAVYSKNVVRFVLERVLRTEFLISTRVHADEIFPGDVFGSSCPYGAIAFLRKEGPAVEVLEVTDANVDSLANEIAQSADLNESLADLQSEHQTAVIAWRGLEHDLFVELLHRRGALAYLNTRAMDLDHLDGFLDRILGSPDT